MAVWIKDKYGKAVGDLGADFNNLKNTVNNLSQITLKNNLSNQEAAGLRITKTPTDDNDVIRKKDIKWERIVNNTSSINANTRTEWNVTYENGMYEHIITVAVSGVDYNLSWPIEIPNDPGYKRVSPTFNFGSDGNNLNTSLSIKVWVQGGKFLMYCNQNVPQFRVWRRKLF